MSQTNLLLDFVKEWHLEISNQYLDDNGNLCASTEIFERIQAELDMLQVIALLRNIKYSNQLKFVV